jgi:lambda family phage tail tape measure protein
VNQDLAFRVSAQTSGEQALTDFAKRLKDLENNAKGISSGMALAGNALKALAGAFAIREIVDFGKSIIDLGANLKELSEKSGINVNDLSGLQEAAKQSGISFEGLSTGLKKYSQSIADAKDGNQQALAAFKNLGITFQDLQTKSPEEVLLKLADNFTKLQDGPEKAANALKIFGKAGDDFIPLLDRGSKALSQFSLGISDDFAERALIFNQSVDALESQLKKLSVQGFQQMLPALQNIVNAFSEIPKYIQDNKTVFKDFGEGLKDTIYVVTALGTAAIDTADAVGTLIKAIKAQSQLDSAGYNKAINDFLDRSDKRQKFLDSFKTTLFAPTAALPKQTPNDQKQKPSIEGLGGGNDNSIQKFIEQQQLQNDQLKESLGDYELTAVELKKVKAARLLDRDELKASNGLTDEQKQKLAASTEEIKKQRLALIDQEHQQQRTFGYGAKKAFDDYVENASNAAKNAQEFFNVAFKGMEDGLVDFVKTGIFNFQKFSTAVIDELIRITVRQQVLAPIIGSFGSLFGGSATAPAANSAGGAIGNTSYAANGGIMTSRGMTQLNRYANGGIATSPQLAVFGEGSTPEAYVPLPDGRRIPVSMKGGGDACSVIVNVDTGSGAVNTSGNSGASDQAKQFGNLVGNMIKRELINQKRPGGILAS